MNNRTPSTWEELKRIQSMPCADKADQNGEHLPFLIFEPDTEKVTQYIGSLMTSEVERNSFLVWHRCVQKHVVPDVTIESILEKAMREPEFLEYEKNMKEATGDLK